MPSHHITHITLTYPYPPPLTPNPTTQQDGEGAKVDISFIDGTSMNLLNFEGKVLDLEEEMYQRASEIEYTMELEGKSLE